MRLKLLTTVVLLSIIAGCSSTPVVNPANTNVLVQVAVDVAVATAVQKGASASKINTIAKELLALDTGSTAALAAIETALNVQLAKLNLPPADLAAAQLLAASLEAIVQTQIASGVPGVSGSAQVAIALVLNDVIQATTAYGIKG